MSETPEHFAPSVSGGLGGSVTAYRWRALRVCLLESGKPFAPTPSPLGGDEGAYGSERGLARVFNVWSFDDIDAVARAVWAGMPSTQRHEQ